jgi:hypothetical protein
MKFRPMQKQTELINLEFLEWFIGFSEGDGSFSFHEGRPKFVINQADLQVLNRIRSNLGFGIVRTFKQNNRVYGRYTVGTRENVRRVIALFNGNLQFDKTQKRFEQWVQAYNRIFGTNIKIQPKRRPTDINLKSSWLAGIFDSEGGFHAHIATTEIRYRGQITPPPERPIRFRNRLYVKAYFDQQLEIDCLNHIANLFSIQKVTVRNKEKEHYRLEFSSKPQLKLLLDYFKNHKLKSRKLDAYAIWNKLTNLYVNSLHLEKMKELEKSVDRLKEVNNLFKELKDVLMLLKEEQETL